MDIMYIGHSSFLVTSEGSGIRILFDPYDPDSYPGKLNYLPYYGEADLVLASHSHGDHFTLKYVQGDPDVINEPGDYIFNNISIKGIETYHDKCNGSERGKNIVFKICMDDMTLAHMGDLGHLLTQEQISEIGHVDIILVPIGGYFTINADEALETAAALNAKIIIPMHYATEKCSLPIAKLENFTQGKTNVVRLGVNQLRPTAIPAVPAIVVLEPKA